MKLLLVTEVAEILRCSVSTVYSLLESGKLVGHRCPGWRVRQDDLEDYIGQARREPPARRRKAPLPRLKHVQL